MSKMASSLSGPAHTRKFAHCRLISTGNAHFGKTYAIYTHCNLHARGSQRKSPGRQSSNNLVRLQLPLPTNEVIKICSVLRE